MKIISFYLPQFHTIPENDLWWGKGFTEWVNVKNATPLFKDHKQPKVPLNNNYYNLLNNETKQWQISLAKKAGVDAFCFYHYWFNGKLMLEKPLQQFLLNSGLDIEFCLSWANPPWTKIWANKGGTILIDQKYGGKAEWKNHFLYLLPFFKDDRYIKEGNKPLFIIYEPSQIPKLNEMIAFFNDEAINHGFDGMKFAYQYYLEPKKDKNIRKLFDYDIEFQPIYSIENNRSRLKAKFIKKSKKISLFLNRLFKISVEDAFLKKIRIDDYDVLWEKILAEKPKDCKSIPGAFVNWDNSPRRGSSGRVVINSSPEKFEKYMYKLIIKAKNEYKSNYLFITAWNEWAEGSYLEPDVDNNHEYINALKNAKTRALSDGLYDEL